MVTIKSSNGTYLCKYFFLMVVKLNGEAEFRHLLCSPRYNCKVEDFNQLSKARFMLGLNWQMASEGGISTTCCCVFFMYFERGPTLSLHCVVFACMFLSLRDLSGNRMLTVIDSDAFVGLSALRKLWVILILLTRGTFNPPLPARLVCSSEMPITRDPIAHGCRSHSTQKESWKDLLLLWLGLWVYDHSPPYSELVMWKIPKFVHVGSPMLQITVRQALCVRLWFSSLTPALLYRSIFLCGSSNLSLQYL